ncbi:lipoprotein [Amaricoccus sp.]|nr:lipoprotein [Amaricoccus sp.]
MRAALALALVLATLAGCGLKGDPRPPDPPDVPDPDASTETRR